MMEGKEKKKKKKLPAQTPLLISQSLQVLRKVKDQLH